MPDNNQRRDIVALLRALAVVLPEAQARLDGKWLEDLRLSLAPIVGLEELDAEALRSVAATLLSGRITLASQSAELSCHVSTARETGTSLGASLRFTPISVEMSLRHREVVGRACRISITVQQTPLPSDQPHNGEHHGTST